MKILSWNVNGIRSVYRKNFLKWFIDIKADIICLQEIRAQPEQFPSDLLNISGYNLYLNSAIQKGYAGVAIYVNLNQKIKKEEYNLGFKRFDQEGRIIKLECLDFILINLYLPHGGHRKENLSYKIEAYQFLFNYLKKHKKENIILIGDFNVAHQEIDLARPKENQDNIMFTPKEREQIDEIINLGLTDTFRKLNTKGGHYTWWSYGHNARERNLGWRIDYIFTSEKITSQLKNAFILSQVNISDHCPIGIEL